MICHAPHGRLSSPPIAHRSIVPLLPPRLDEGIELVVNLFKLRPHLGAVGINTDTQMLQRLISETVENEKEKIALRNETQQLNATLREEVRREVSDRLALELQRNEDLQRLRGAAMTLAGKAVAMADAAEKIEEVKGAMAVVEGASRVVKTQSECVLGKTPDTAIQINNSAPTRIERVIVDAH